MQKQLIKKDGNDIPIKELELCPGINKILPAAMPPVLSVCKNETDRSAADRLTICVLGEGIRKGDGFSLPSMTYKELFGLFDNTPVHTYSAKNGFFGYRSVSGRFLSLEELINCSQAYAEGHLDFGKLACQKPEAVITVSSGGKSLRIQAAQVYDDDRYFYPLLTSEQILDGLKPADSRGEKLKMGFIRTGEEEQEYQVIFVIGQRNWNDITEEIFVAFTDGGASVTIEYLPESRKKHNILYVGPIGGELGQDVLAYQGRGKDTVEISAREGSLIRFNIDNNDFLNKAKMYYKFSVDDEECKTPYLKDGYVYNTRIPLYFGSGADYPSGIILPLAEKHKSIQIKIMAFGPECPETEVDSFKIFITENN